MKMSSYFAHVLSSWALTATVENSICSFETNIAGSEIQYASDFNTQNAFSPEIIYK